MKNFKYLFIFIIIIILTGCGYDEYKMPESAFINIINKSYLVFSKDGKLSDLIGDNNVEIENLDEKLDTDKIGNRIATIKYKYNNKLYKYDINYEVKDTTPPIVISAPTYRAILVNSDANFCDEVNMADNYDPEPTCLLDGDYDFTKSGTYKTKLILKDSSNNQTIRNLTIIVYDEWPSSNNNNSNSSKNIKPRINFNDVINNYKNENNEIGIDISKWQGDIDFEKVKNAGASFVIMRLGVNTDIDEDISEDSYFRKNIENAKNAGLKVGVYVYTASTSIEKSIEHADWVVKALDGIKLDFPIAYDWENWKKFRSYKISIHQFNENFKAFDEELKKNGYNAMIYGSKYYLENFWTIRDDYPVWLAHYTSKTDYKDSYMLWQLSNVGRIDGIAGDVDIDIHYLN